MDNIHKAKTCIIRAIDSAGIVLADANDAIDGDISVDEINEAYLDAAIRELMDANILLKVALVEAAQ